MDEVYADTVRLLLQVAPDVFDNDMFAMKGGTAINLFVRDMPRLSVDIDVVYTPWQAPREQALAAIATELDAISSRAERLGLTARKVASKDLGDTKLLIESAENQVKVEVNAVFRGTVLPPERRALTPRTAAMFSAELEIPVLATAELYGGHGPPAPARLVRRVADVRGRWSVRSDGGMFCDLPCGAQPTDA